MTGLPPRSALERGIVLPVRAEPAEVPVITGLPPRSVLVV